MKAKMAIGFNSAMNGLLYKIFFQQYSLFFRLKTENIAEIGETFNMFF